MKSLIFDLRGDPGGLLDQGVGVADLFLDPGQRVVSMRGRTPAAIARVRRRRAAAVAEAADRRARRQQLGERGGDRRRRAAGSRSRAAARHDDVRQGKRAERLSAVERRRGEADDRALVHAVGAQHQSRRRDARRTRCRAPTRARSSGRRYKTDAGRTVLGGGGITPDVILPPRRSRASDTAFQRALGTQVPKFRDALTDYALSLKASHAVTSPDFVVTPAMRAELLRRMRGARHHGRRGDVRPRRRRLDRPAARLRDRALRRSASAASSRGACATIRWSTATRQIVARRDDAGRAARRARRAAKPGEPLSAQGLRLIDDLHALGNREGERRPRRSARSSSTVVRWMWRVTPLGSDRLRILE